uniref:DUF1772-domain-containing protein n=1 Tax=Acrobeloides nanus TaxID=290746 RepID=A0A914EFW4_9BILA
MLAGQLAIVEASLFTGVSLCISLEQLQHLRNRNIDDKNLLSAFQGTFRSAKIQPLLAVTGTALGAYQYTKSKEIFWAVGTGLFFLIIPYTLTFFVGINKELMAASPETAGAETRKKIVKWGKLHSVRTILGAASVAAFVYAVVRK